MVSDDVEEVGDFVCVCVLMHFVWKWPGMMVGALAAAQLSSAEAAAVVPEPSCRHCAAEFGSPEFRPVVVL